MKSVYSAVRTGSLNKTVCASSVKDLCQSLKLLPCNVTAPVHHERAILLTLELPVFPFSPIPACKIVHILDEVFNGEARCSNVSNGFCFVS